MLTQSNFTSRLFAAVSAFALSLVLITGTVTAPGPAQAQTVYASVAA
jgi:hypothetical protein